MTSTATSSKGMMTDLEGRVERLNFALGANVYRPLIEAIHNSIDSIEHSPEVKTGKITIKIERLAQQNVSDEIRAQPQPVLNILITDNGKGFTKENLESFQTLDSRLKLKRGGKGIGRLFWLKVFKSVEIESVYEAAGKRYRRIINLTQESGCVDEPPVQVDDKETISTTIKLKDYKPLYESVFRTRKPSSVASDIGRHFLLCLLFGKPTQITLIDGSEIISIDKKKLAKPASNKFTVYGEKFEIHHLRVPAGAESHVISLCASGMAVEDIKLPELDIPVGKKAKIKRPDGTEYHYVGLVTAPFLDKTVNAERCGFNFDRQQLEIDGLPLKYVNQAILNEKLKEFVEEFLAEDLIGLQKSKESRIDEVLNTNLSAMKYLKQFNKEQIERLPLDDTSEELEKKLALLHHQNHVTVAQEAEAVLKRIDIENPESIKFQDDLKKFEKVLEVHQADLGQYVLYRAWILDVLVKLSSKRTNEKFEYEKALHSLIFPMKIDAWKGANPGINKHNLWLVDERFAMFDYITSDLEISKHQVLDGVTDLDRPDLCCYFFGENSKEAPITNIALVELKRPGKDKPYSGEEDGDAIQQLLDYVLKLRTKHMKDKEGRPISVVSQTKIFCYLICDIENDYVEKLARLHRMKSSFDNAGFYDYFTEPYDTYLEVISLNKLLTHARHRNKAFFEKLGLPTTGLND